MLHGQFSLSEPAANLGTPICQSRQRGIATVWRKPWGVASLDRVSDHHTDRDTGAWVAWSGHAWWRIRRTGAPPSPVTARQLLERLQTHGAHALKEIDGTFAVAWFDPHTASVSLARDYFGIEPFYFALFPDRVVFASKMREIIGLLPSSPRLSPAGLRDYLVYCYGPGSPTLIDGVERVEPGCLVSFHVENDRVVSKSERWHHISYRDHTLVEESRIIEEFRAALDLAVRRRVDGERPAVMLSGGMDSSAVLSFMRRYEPGEIKTYSFRCGGKAFDESTFAAGLAEKLGTKHAQLEFTEKDALEFGEGIRAMDSPFSDCGIEIGTWIIAKKAGEEARYIMTGDGGDEFWASHPVYAAQRLMRVSDVVPIGKGPRRWARSMANSIGDSAHKRDLRVVAKRLIPDPDLPLALRHGRWKVYHDAAGVTSLVDGLALPNQTSEQFYSSLLKAYDGFDGKKRSLDAMLYNDYYTASAFYFSRLLFFRARGVEPRMPFFDAELVALGARIPFNMKLEGIEVTKRLFRESMRGVVPDLILDRKSKLGHSVPMKNWLREKGALHRELSGVVLEELAGRRGLVKRRAVEKLLHEHETAKENHSHRLWALFVLEHWLKTYLDRKA